MPKKILVVDNSPVIVRLMENFLSKEGHYVLCAVDGLEALEILQTFRPDVIFVDLVMPRIPGEKLCRIVRTMPELQETFVIVLSAVAVEQDLDFAAFGAHACIAKGPFKEVEKNILSVFATLERGEVETLATEVIGTENVFKRIVTEELLSVKRHFDTTLTHMHEGFLELTLDGRIVYVNPAAAAILGQKEETILAASLHDFFAQEQAVLLRESIARLDEQPVVLGEGQPFQRDNRYLAFTLVKVVDREQQGVIAIIQDITARKTAELELLNYQSNLEELVRVRTKEITSQHHHLVEEMQRSRQIEAEKLQLEATLRQTHKMEALGTMAAGIAHDFNNILTAIIGLTELTQRTGCSDQHFYDNLEQVKKAGWRARDLIKQILIFSRNKEHEVSPVRIQEILKEALKLLRASTQANIAIREIIDPTCGQILADATQIHQIIMNLCTNGTHAMKNTGGVLEIRLERAELPRMNADTPPATMVKFVKLTVADTGVGIDHAILEKIFDPYFTTKGAGEGTGMGLAVVHGIVTNHGGEVAVSSTPGQGATFTVFFPELSTDAETKLSVAGPILRGHESILIVDDDPNILHATRMILQDLGYRISTAATGEEALRIFEGPEGDVDLVFTDQVMPGISGLELAGKMLALRPQLPIILCTGQGEIIALEQLEALGIKELLLKPFYISELAASIRKALGAVTK